MIAATPRQQQALDFIDTFSRSHGYSPSFPEIATALGLASRSNVHQIIAALERKGLITRRHNCPRTLVVVHPVEAA